MEALLQYTQLFLKGIYPSYSESDDFETQSTLFQLVLNPNNRVGYKANKSQVPYPLYMFIVSSLLILLSNWEPQNFSSLSMVAKLFSNIVSLYGLD